MRFSRRPPGEEQNAEIAKTSFMKNCMMVALALSEIPILIAVGCVLAIQSAIKIFQAVCLVLSLLTLSLVWCPSVQLFTLRSKEGSYNGRNRGDLVFTVFKFTALVVGTILVFMMDHADVSFEGAAYKLTEGIQFVYEPKLFNPFVISCLSAFGSFCISSLSTYACVPFAGVTLPAIMSTPMAAAVCIYMCVSSIFPSPNVHICLFTTPTYVTLVLAAMGWMITFLLFGRKLQKTSRVCMKPPHESYISRTWNNFFLEQQNVLSYKHDGIHKSNATGNSVAETSNTKTSRVFVCTTMYRESDYEMESLLRSIQRLSTSKRLADVYLEYHIFLDNGARKCELTEFSIQLLSLLESKLEVHMLDSVTSETPYGIQLQWKLPGNMPLFVHLKDSKKFKAKKRWSQVMYMKYILDYRVRKSRHRRGMVESDSGIDMHQIREHASASTPSIINVDDISVRYFSSRTRLDASDNNGKLEDGKVETLQQKEQLGSRNSIDLGIEMDSISTLSIQNNASHINDTGDGEMKQSITHINECERKIFTADVNSRIDRTTLHVNENCHNSTIPDPLSRTCNTTELIATFPQGNIVSEVMADTTTNTVSQRTVPQQPDVFTYSNNSNNIQTISGSITDHRMYDIEEDDVIDDQTYILATDADVEFTERSLQSVLETCNQDKRLGGACGRTCPVGRKTAPVVWFQKFEYVKDFWMTKSAQNVIGSIMCCPGCFSLYRANALEETCVEYSKPTEAAFDVFVKDTGEDRWMCTLMMMNGWRLKYTSACLNTTHCPDTFEEFLKQRRRWLLSDMTNTVIVLRNFRRLSSQNPCFSVVYILYILQMFVASLLTPGTDVLMLAAGLDMILSVPFYYIIPIYSIALVLYIIVCVSRYTHLQTLSTIVLVILIAVNMSIIMVGGGIFVLTDVMREIREGTLQFQERYILIFFMLIVIFAAILHPRDVWLLVYGLFYFFFFPAKRILLPLYATANIVDQSWGTRDDDKTSTLSCLPASWKRKEKKKTNAEGSRKNGETEWANNVFLPMSEGTYDQQVEFRFWREIKAHFLGNNVNLGLSKDELANELTRLRFKVVLGMALSNALWLSCLCVLFWYTSTAQISISVYGLSVYVVLYGLSFTVQLLGMITDRVKVAINNITRKAVDIGQQEWVTDLLYRR